MTSLLDSELVHDAYLRIRHSVVRTPVLTSKLLSEKASFNLQNLVKPMRNRESLKLFFKAENLQETGSFKFRGALNSVAALPDDKLLRGLVTTSSGNHAKALAAAASRESIRRGMAIPVWAVMPEDASASKIRDFELLGGEVVRSGASWSNRCAALAALHSETGATVVSSDSTPDILLGQGTVGLEFVEQIKETYTCDLDCIVAPCGTGGLLAGLALALQDTPISVFGVEPSEGADDASRGRKDGVRITKVSSKTLADGLRSPVGPVAWDVIKNHDLVKDIVCVTEEQIRLATHLAATDLKLVIEPSAAVGLAAVLFSEPLWQKLPQTGSPCRIGIVLTGGNIAIDNLANIIRQTDGSINA